MLKIIQITKNKPNINNIVEKENIPNKNTKRKIKYFFDDKNPKQRIEHFLDGKSFMAQRNIPYHSLSPTIPNDAFYVRMNGYGTNENWAQEMRNLTYIIADDIRTNEDFDEILIKIERDIRRINSKEEFGRRRITQWAFLLAPEGRGEEYYEKYKSKLGRLKPYEAIYVTSNIEYVDANTCKIYMNDFGNILINYGWNPGNRGGNLKLAKKEFEKLRSIENPTDEEINRSAATIHWLIAQESPWQRGSDSIANVLTKAIYLAYGMKISPIKEGKSFDFEAFYSDLDDYIKKYPNLFEIPPHRE